MSTDIQLKGDSLRRQLSASRSYAEKHELVLVDSLQDIGVSAFHGKNASRGALADFLAAIESGEIRKGDVLIVESLDRLSRSKPTKALKLFLDILEAGVKIVTLMDEKEYTNDSVDDNASDLLTSIIYMVRANEESETKSKRLSSVWEKKRQQIGTKKLTKQCPAWLRFDENSEEFVPKDSLSKSTIQKIFTLSLQGAGAYSISRSLNDYPQQYPPLGRAQKWHTSYVKKILRNPAVYGQLQPHVVRDGKRVPEGQPILDYYPAIVDHETFVLAQARMSNRLNGGGRKGVGFSNLFTKLLVCGSCGGTITFRNHGRPPKGGKYLRCQNAELKNGCQAPAWRYDEFERDFFSHIADVDFTEIFADDAQTTRKEDLRTTCERLDFEITSETSSYDTLRTRISDASISDELASSFFEDLENLNRSIQEKNKRRDQAAAELAELEAQKPVSVGKDIVSALQTLSDGDDLASLEEKRRLLNSKIKRVIDQVVIYNNETIYPWEIDDRISSGLLSDLHDRGYKTTAKIENLLSTDYGRRLFNRSERRFIVRYQNGTIREVWPYKNRAILTRSEEMTKMIQR